MRNIGQDRIRAIHIPLLPTDEWRRMVVEVERRLPEEARLSDYLMSRSNAHEQKVL